MIVFCLASGPPAGAQGASPWSAVLTTERADVSNSGNKEAWITDAFQLSRSQPESGGWFGSVERAKRNGVVDVTLATRAYARAGDWTFLAGGGATPDAHFLYRGFGEVEVSRRVVGSLVASGEYRFLAFPQADIHQVQPALTWYHRRGELGARLFVTRNVTQRRTTPALLVRTIYKAAPRLELSGGASYGDQIGRAHV